MESYFEKMKNDLSSQPVIQSEAKDLDNLHVNASEIFHYISFHSE